MSNLTSRPYVISKAAISLDAYLDDDSPSRLVLSSKKDLAQVQRLRARVDAVLIGSETLRKDNPSLSVEGASSQPLAVVLCNKLNLPLELNLFSKAKNKNKPLVFLPRSYEASIDESIKASMEVEFCESESVEVSVVLEKLAQRGVRKLLVEGGAKIHQSFLEAAVVDEFRLSIAPVYLGKPSGRQPASFSKAAGLLRKSFKLDSVETLGACCIHHYRVVSK